MNIIDVSLDAAEASMTRSMAAIAEATDMYRAGNPEAAMDRLVKEVIEQSAEIYELSLAVQCASSGNAA